MQKKSTRTLFFFLSFLCSYYSATATIRYVKPLATGTGSGLSWANASADLQGMINASTSGDEVWVAAGTYLPTRDLFGNANPNNLREKTFYMQSGVDVYGGFGGSETSTSARSIKINVTILSGDIGTPIYSGDNSYHVVTQSIINDTSKGCVLDGFTIKDGLANSSSSTWIGSTFTFINHDAGAGIFARGGAYSIYRNLCVYNNYADAAGGGGYFYGGFFLIQNDSVYSNSAFLGGGIRGEYGVDSIDKCVIYGNSAGGGGGAYLSNKSAITNSVIFNNYGTYAGGVEGRGKFSCVGSFIYNNTSSYQGAGMLIDGDAFEVVNNVIFNNRVFYGSGGGIFVNGGDNGIINNNTFYGNVTNYGGRRGTALWLVFGSAIVTNNLFWNNNNDGVYGWEIDTSPFTPSTLVNNIFQHNGNPLLADSSKPLGIDNMPGTIDDGLRLTLCSRAVNAGATLNPAIPKDIIGNSRVGNYDIGAYEFQGSGPIHAGPITGDSVFCLYHSITLSNSAKGGVWSSSNSAVAPISQFGALSGISLGSSMVTYVADSSGCPSSIAKKNIIVTTFAPVNAIVGPDSVCTSRTIQFTNSTPGGTWSSSDTSKATVDNKGLVKGTGQGTAIIRYTLGPQNCSTVATKAVTVGATPIVNPITINYHSFYFCVLDTMQFSNTTIGGIWSTTSNGLIGDITPSGLLIPRKPGYDSVKYFVSNSFGCVQQVAVQVLLGAPPAGINDPIQGNDSVCEGDTISLSHSVVAGRYETDYSTWKSDDTSVAIVKRTGKGQAILIGVGAGTVTVTYTLPGPCITKVSKLVTIVGLPQVGVISGGSEVCQNSTLQLTNVAQGGIWETSSKGNVSSISNAGLVIPSTYGYDTVIYTVTNNFGCTDKVSKRIYVVLNPIVSAIIGLDSICTHQTSLYTNSRVGGKWFSSDTLIASVDTGGYVNGINKGLATISYRVINVFGCTTTVSKDIFVKEVPVLTPIAGDSTVCVNTKEQYYNSTPGGIWTLTGSWIIGSLSPSGLFTVNGVGPVTIWYKVVNNYGCSSIVSLPVIANLPQKVSITGADSVCQLGKIELKHDFANGVWTNSNSVLGAINNDGIYLSRNAGMDSVYYKYSSNGCAAEAIKLIKVNQLPDTALISGKTMICKTEMTVLNASIKSGVWSCSSSDIAEIDNDGVVVGKMSGTVDIKYTLTNSANCQNSSVYSLIVNEANPSAYQDGINLLAVGNQNGAIYKWVDCDNNYKDIPGANNHVFTPLKNGQYAVIVNYQGCADTSVCMKVTSLGYNPNDEYPLVFPNPANDKITINTGSEMATAIQLFDVAGRMVIEVKPTGFVTQISIKGFVAGMYKLNISYNEKNTVRKLIIL